MLVMKSMELDDEAKLDACMPIPMECKPDYPYGLRICFTEQELEKLDIDPDEACVDGIFHMHALARVTSVSCDQRDGKKTYRVEAQIESMAVEAEDLENK